MSAKVNVSRNVFALVAIVLLGNFFVLAEVATAGQATAASIIGQVTDESGAVLPGVTVTATSPALQIPEVMSVTDERGEYRLSPLPIGTYQVAYDLAGFQSLRREELRLTVGFTARVDVALKVGAVAETVTVSGVAPVVDVSSTSASTQFTRETLELIPGGRNGLTSLLAQAPGVRTTWDVGGSGANARTIFRAFGQAGEPWNTLEGIATSNLGGTTEGGSGNYFDYSTFEEARVSTVGNDAEMPTRGIQIVGVVKSGGNELHGGGSWGQFPAKLQSNNIDDGLRAQGVERGNPIVKRYDVGADLGGRIIRNKLWWYLAARRRVDVQETEGVFKPDGSVAFDDQLGWFHTEKLSYQMTPSHRFVAFHQYNHKWDVSGASEFVAWESRNNKPTLPGAGKLEWQGLRGNSLVMGLQVGYWQNRAYFYSNDRGPYVDREPGEPVGVSATDIFTMYTNGESAGSGTRLAEPRIHSKGSVSWYRPDFFYGNHEVKAGFDFLSTKYGSWQTSRQSGNYQLVFNNGAPFQIRTWNIPYRANAVTRYTGVYVKDSWTVARRLTLSLGVRYAHNPGFVPASCREAGDFATASCFERVEFNTWNTVAPRVHAAYDITGDGRTVIKGGWGRFDHMRSLAGELSNADPNVKTTTTYRWRDPNGNRVYDPGEINLDVNGPDFVSESGGSNTVANPHEREPKVDELSASFERELAANLALRITGIYSRTIDPYRTVNLLRPFEAYTIPVTNPDPGFDGRVGTADDPGTFVTYFEFPAALSGRRNERFTLINDPEASQSYKSFELATFKRLSSGWQFAASYSATKKNVPFVNGVTPSDAASTVYAAPADPNSEIFATDRTWEWMGKASGAYLFPADVMVSAGFEHRSGKPWARQVLFTGGRTIPSITLRVEPFGARRLPNTNLLDLRVQKGFRLMQGHKLEVRVNVYNVLNGNTVLEVVRRAGPSFLKPTPGADGSAIMQPRIFEFSTSYVF